MRTRFGFLITLATGIGVALWILLYANCTVVKPALLSDDPGEIGYPDSTEQWVF